MTEASPQIDPRSPVPKYHQLQEILLELVDTALAVDAPIPSERELADRYALSRMTVRQAIDGLVVEGRLYRVQGRGTYVARQKTDLQIRLASFTEDMRSRGMRASSRVLSFERIAATPHLARDLEVPVGEPVLRLERLRSADGIPMSVERTHVPERLVPGLLERGLIGSLYTALEEQYGLVLDWGEQTIEAATSEPADAKLLEIGQDVPVLWMRRYSYAGHQRVEYAASAYRSDRYQLWVPLSRPTAAHRFPRAHEDGA
ncbi:MAG: GntR family transcriptional regulator, N-acetylglucosamine utilization regulator [Actinomycetota bacterium]|jgi:GntR family transcriptional regulator|nr:GntR family transcriptional regulator, N-acetylglucosamine utilization regulator [Actinomycetota bacterium]